MKAIVITRPGGTEVLELQEVPDPLFGPDDLLVRVYAAAVNRADVRQRVGGYPQPGNPSGHNIPGLEFAGEVLHVGERAEGFAVGERVMGLIPGQGYAELVSLPARHAMKVPGNLNWHEAGGVWRSTLPLTSTVQRYVWPL